MKRKGENKLVLAQQSAVKKRADRKLGAFPRPNQTMELKAHHDYVSKIATAFARHLERKRKLAEGSAEIIGIAAGVHDIGKMQETVEKAIAGTKRLGSHRRFEMERHVPEGLEILNQHWNSRVPEIKARKKIAQIIENHHEHFDGSGYPNGRRGKQIPLESRILSVADVYCALTEPRSYKESMPEKKALGILNESAGKGLDPELVEEFTEFIKTQK